MAGGGRSALTDSATRPDSGTGPADRQQLGELAYRCLVAALWAVLALVLLLDDRGVLTPDIKPEIYLAPLRTARDLLPAWLDTQQLGLPNFNVGLAPVAAVVAALQALGPGPAASVRVLHLLLLVIAGWGATRLYREVAERPESRTGRLLTGVLYVANPYTVVAGDTLAVSLPLAFLPWQVLFLVRALTRPPGWRWPAAVALTFVAMSGMNAGVVPILQLVVVPAVVAYAARKGTNRRTLLAQLARTGLLSFLVSLYWLLPALSATGVGSNVLGNSETLDGIATPSSPAEVLRGLGLWVMYGAGIDGPWQPGFAPYLTGALVVVLSFVGPVLLVLAVLRSRGPARRLVLDMVVTAAVVMVGLHPPTDPTPVGRVLRYAFDHVAALGALRTTNKAGAVLVLGIALAAGLLGATLRSALSGRARFVTALVLAVAVVGSTWPAWTGGLFNDHLAVPDYWRQAAAATDDGPSDNRVWLLPGEVRSHYRWSQERVDDIDKSLLARPPLVHTTIPNASAASANFQTAVDTTLQDGAMPPGALASAARYLGVGDLLVRHDLVWEQTRGARPSLAAEEVSSDPGLELVAGFGRPGENVTAPGAFPQPAEAALPPVQRYAVRDSRPIARVEPVRGSVLVDGDGWALAPLVAAGLLPGDPAFRYVGDLSRPAFAHTLLTGTRLVLTDTNRRRTAAIGQLSDTQGPLLRADEDPGPTRTLFGPGTQTVLDPEGGTVTASSQGGTFFSASGTSPSNAFDGDARTGWVFGDFGRGAGQDIRIALPSPVPVSEVRLLLRPRGPVTVSRVRLELGGVRRVVHVPPSGQVRLDVPSTRTGQIRLRVLRTRGTGINPVGVDEISVAGVQVRRVARLPVRIARLVDGLGGDARQALSLTPVDVVFSRSMATRIPDDDEETGLNRDFWLPQSRAYRLYGVLRPDSAATDDRLDELLGVSGDVVATSSSRAFDNPDVRASYAVDGNAYTGWSPADPAVGAWLQLDGAPRRVRHVDVQQTGGVGRVQVLLDGRPVTEAALQPGDNRIPVPAQTAGRLRLVITERAGTGPVHVTEVGFGDARTAAEPARALNRCTTVATLDGASVRMRPVAPLTGVGPTLFAGCGERTVLTAGEHELRAVPDWMPDELVLRDALGDHDPVPVDQPRTIRVLRLSGSHWRISADLPAGPQLLVLGQNWDPRWVARLNGTSLGRPVVADGYSAAWVVEAPGRHTFDVTFAPQRRATAGLVLSGLGLLLCLGLALRLRRQPDQTAPERAARRRRTATRTVGREALGWLVVVATALFLGGLLVGAVALGLAAVHAVRRLPASLLLIAALVLVLLTPAAFLVGNVSRWGDVSSALVADNPWPGRTAACALLLLVVGVWRQDRERG